MGDQCGSLLTLTLLTIALVTRALADTFQNGATPLPLRPPLLYAAASPSRSAGG